MIFRKLLCGGFGILMSQNDQVEKNLAFQCQYKMVGLLQHGSIMHGLNPQLSLKDSKNPKIPPRETKALPQTPQDIPKQLQTL